MDYASLQQRNEQLETEVVSLKAELKELKRLIFGSKRERYVPEVNSVQLSLLPDQVKVSPDPTEHQVYRRKVAESLSATLPSRKLLPTHLPRVEVILEPDEDTTAMKKIGEQISEELDADGQSINPPNCTCVVM